MAANLPLLAKSQSRLTTDLPKLPFLQPAYFITSDNLGKFFHLLFSLSSTLFHATDREKFPPTEAMGHLAWGRSAILSITNRTICLNKRKQKRQRVAGAP
jgi:hypothetical protein